MDKRDRNEVPDMGTHWSLSWRSDKPGVALVLVRGVDWNELSGQKQTLGFEPHGGLLLTLYVAGTENQSQKCKISLIFTFPICLSQKWKHSHESAAAKTKRNTGLWSTNIFSQATGALPPTLLETLFYIIFLDCSLHFMLNSFLCVYILFPQINSLRQKKDKCRDWE